MVLTVFLHMSLVFYHGAYKPPREFNWVVGVILLLLTLLLSFTGYLLPWDQLALWAVTVGTTMGSYAPVFGDQVSYALTGGVEGMYVDPGTLGPFHFDDRIHLYYLTFVLAVAVTNSRSTRSQRSMSVAPELSMTKLMRFVSTMKCRMSCVMASGLTKRRQNQRQSTSMSLWERN